MLFLPLLQEEGPRLVKVREEACACLLRRLRGIRTACKGNQKLTVLLAGIDFGREANVSIGCKIGGGQRGEGRECFESVGGGAHITARHVQGGRVDSDRKTVVRTLRKQHGNAFVVADPGGVLLTLVTHVRLFVKAQLQWDGGVDRGEADAHEERVTDRIGDNVLHQGGVPFFVGEEVFSVGDEEPDRSCIRLIDIGKVNLVERAVANREPDAAFGRGGRAHQRLGTRTPRRLVARLSGGSNR